VFSAFSPLAASLTAFNAWSLLAACLARLVCSIESSKLRALIFSWWFLWHVTISLGPKDLRRSFPDEEATFRSRGDDELLVWRDGNLGDGSRVSDTLIVADSLVIVPELDDLVFSS
jgi:hypothetical protein